MIRKRWLVLAAAVAVCVLTPGCSDLSKYLDGLKDDSLKCAESAQAEFRRCMAADPTSGGPAPPGPPDGLVHLP